MLLFGVRVQMEFIAIDDPCCLLFTFENISNLIYQNNWYVIVDQ